MVIITDYIDQLTIKPFGYVPARVGPDKQKSNLFQKTNFAALDALLEQIEQVRLTMIQLLDNEEEKKKSQFNTFWRRVAMGINIACFIISISCEFYLIHSYFSDVKMHGKEPINNE